MFSGGGAQGGGNANGGDAAKPADAGTPDYLKGEPTAPSSESKP